MKNMTKEMMKLVNGKQSIECYFGTHDLRVGNTVDGLAVFTKNWWICNADEIDELVEELNCLKQVIECVKMCSH